MENSEDSDYEDLETTIEEDQTKIEMTGNEIKYIILIN